jgi:hypothetical protein
VKYDETLASLQALAALDAFEVGPRLDVDTSGPVNIGKLVREIRSALTRCLTATDRR